MWRIVNNNEFAGAEKFAQSRRCASATTTNNNKHQCKCLPPGAIANLEFQFHECTDLRIRVNQSLRARGGESRARNRHPGLAVGGGADSPGMKVGLNGADRSNAKLTGKLASRYAGNIFR